MKRDYEINEKNEINEKIWGFVYFVISLPASARQIDFTELDKLALEELKQKNTPGAAVAVIRDGRLIYARGYGVASVETGSPVTPEMLFRLGSTTKMLTASALVTLAAAGKLKLDAPIGNYRGVHVVTHGGASTGYGSTIQLVPEHKFAVIVLTNRSGETLPRLREKALELVLPLKPPEKEEVKSAPPLSEAEMAGYVGTYTHAPRTWFNFIVDLAQIIEEYKSR